MNEQKSCFHKVKPNRRRVAMARTWQIILFGACSVALSASTVLCGNQIKAKQSNAVAYANQPRQNLQQRNQAQQQQTYLADQRIAHQDSDSVDLNSAAATSYQQQQQPSVYHSIIDATNMHQNPLSPAVQTTTSTVGDLHTAAGHHHDHMHGKYYEYRAVPKPKTWKFGYKRGNHKHTISRHEHGKAGKHPHFKTKVKWHDSKSKGKGIHLWDYNHHDKKHYHHHG